MANPWDNDPIVTPAPSSPTGGRSFPGIIHGPPASPKEPATPSGYRKTPNGNLEYIPGGPADPNKDIRDAPLPGDSSKDGEAYLASLPQNIASQVKLLATGRLAPPSSFALKTPYWQSLLQATAKYAPSFDAVTYNARSKVRQDFTSGNSAKQINAINTALGHMGQLYNQIGDTWSGPVVPLNYLANETAKMFGSAGPTTYETTATNLAPELTRVWRGAGGNEADLQRYLGLLSENHSKAQKVAAIRDIVGLLGSKLDSLADQYNQGMGPTNEDFHALNQHSYDVIDGINNGTDHVPDVTMPGTHSSGGWGQASVVHH